MFKSYYKILRIITFKIEFWVKWDKLITTWYMIIYKFYNNLIFINLMIT